MSTLSVNNIIEKTTGAGVQIPGHVVQFQHQMITLNSGTITSSSMVDLPNVYVDITPKIQQIKVEEPPKRKAGIKVSNVAELVQKLKNEAKVI